MDVFKCNSCDYHSISTKYVCPKCRKGKLEKLEIGSKGEVYSFTDIHIAPAEFSSLAPYTVALIQLNDANVKVTVRMNEPVQIGDTVDLEKIEKGAFCYKKA